LTNYLPQVSSGDNCEYSNMQDDDTLDDITQYMTRHNGGAMEDSKHSSGQHDGGNSYDRAYQAGLATISILLVHTAITITMPQGLLYNNRSRCEYIPTGFRVAH